MKLSFRPGVNKENTPYTEEGGWVDSDKIRFRSGKPEKINGWVRYIEDTIVGVPRASYLWRTLDGTIYLAIASQAKIYLEAGGTLTDITPIRKTSSLTNPFSTASGSTEITVTDASHGADTGAFVTFSGASSVGGVDASLLNAEHQITVVDNDTYTFTVATAATSTLASGGSSVQAEYQINPGSTGGAFQYGWGSGAWGDGTWGTPRGEEFGIEINPTTWSITNWGEDLIFNRRGGAVYTWDASTPTARATQIVEAPHQVNCLTVTADRHLVCFGCNEAGVANAPTTLDAMQIRWCSQEDYTSWVPTSTNTAGSQLLTTGTEIITAANAESQTLVWTDLQVESMQYVGPPYTFGFRQVGTSTSIISPNAWVAYNNVIYWMGDNAFYVFQGGTSVMPCTVQRFVFNNISKQQKYKVFAGLDRENHEITWYYPTNDVEPTQLNGDLNTSDTTISVATTAGFPFSGFLSIDGETISYTGKTDASFTGCTRGTAGTTPTTHSDKAIVAGSASEDPEPSRYVSFNVLDQIWWIGRLERTTWEDRGALKLPIATNSQGVLFTHESGFDADGEPLVAYIESADFDLGEGDRLMFVSQVFPDFTLEGDVDLYMKSRYYPLSDQIRETVGRVTPETRKIDTRIRGRQMSFRVESKNLDDYWKYGSTRIDLRTDGKR